MPIPIHFTKSRAEHLLECLRKGKPFVPPEGGWSGNDMLLLAGVCLFGAISHGPQRWSPASDDWDSFMNDLYGGLTVYSQLAQMVADGEFEKQYGDHLMAIASQPEHDKPPELQIIRHGAEVAH